MTVASADRLTSLAPSHRRFVSRTVEVITSAAAASAAAILALEIVLLLAGIVARFVFRRPIVWSDELASILFVWLAMLGAVIAHARGEHMRLTALLFRLPARVQHTVQLLAHAVPAVFLLLLLPAAVEYSVAEDLITTPALEWPNSIRASAIPAGAVMMLAISLLRLAQHPLSELRWVALMLALGTGVLWVASPTLIAASHLALVVFFVVILMGSVLLGVPIAFAFGLATMSYLVTITEVPVIVLASRMDEGVSSLVLLAVPLFVFLGALIQMTGMAQAMVDFLAAIVGHVRGGLSFVLLAAMCLVSGISGSKAADMAAVAPVLFPEMKRRGSDEGEMVSLLAASGAMTETIPPSIVLIMIGSVAGVSIIALFTGGLLPAIVLACFLAVVALAKSRRAGEVASRRAAPSVVAKTFFIALPALVLPLAIRGVVVEGIATATEVSTVGIAYAVVAGVLLYRRFDWARLFPMLVDTAALSGAILLIIGTATGMAWALTTSGLSRDLAATMAQLPGGAPGFMIFSIVLFVILGSVLEGIPAIVLFGPLLFPVARTFHIHDVHYAMVVILAMGIGLFAPPLGVGYYAACAVAKVDPDTGIRAIWPYMCALLIGVTIVAAVPWLSTGFVSR